MKVKYLLPLLFLLVTAASAQTPTQQLGNIPNVVSPQAFEFTKYGDVPVGLYTGVPEVNIPIYTINAAGLDLPISLSYHSNGIKVNEEASWVGLGWTLNAGGGIVQVVNEYDDFGSYGSAYAFGMIEHPSYFNIPGGVSDCQPKIIRFRLGDNGIDADALTDHYDSEPDIFKFSFMNYSGEFRTGQRWHDDLL